MHKKLQLKLKDQLACQDLERELSACFVKSSQVVFATLGQCQSPLLSRQSFDWVCPFPAPSKKINHVLHAF